MSQKFIITLVTFFIFTSPIFAQESINKKEENELLKKAEAFYEDENYTAAAANFEKLNANKSKDLYYKMMKGICYTFIPEKQKESIGILTDVKNANKKFNEVNFFIGRAYAVNEQFDEAIKYFNIYLEDIDLPKEDRDKAMLFIENCKTANSFVQDSVKVEITNIGAPINTKFEEYVPIITPDERIMIFTYRGEKSTGGRLDLVGNPSKNGQYFEDIMISTKDDGVWSAPKSIGSNINTTKHDAGIAISNNGQKLFIYKSDNKNAGDIYISELKDGNWTAPKSLEGEVNSEYWEGSASLTSDEKILYFTSERKGGYGGRDIYKAENLGNNVWGNVQNLGPTINTRFDEDDPFIHPDNKTMYFSSKGHNSIGGYDIFYSYNDNEVWDEPQNVGYPINTIGDDRYYVLSADAKSGYYSSAGKENSFGGNDIYIVQPGHFGKRPILALVIGISRADGEPVSALVTTTNEKDGSVVNRTNSNAKDGKFMLSLTPGNKYKIAIEVDGYNTSYEYLDVQSLETFVQVEHNFDVTSDDLIGENNDLKASKVNEPDLQEKLNLQISKIREFSETDSTFSSRRDLNDEITKVEKHNQEISNTNNLTTSKVSATNKSIQGLSYKVEIAAVKDSNDFNLGYLSKYGEISKKKYPDGTIRYAFAGFNTLEGAENFRDMLAEKESDAKDAFVTVFVFGERKTVEQYTEEYTLPVAVENDSIMNDPCAKYTMEAFTKFVLKDITDKENYDRLLSLVGPICHPDLHFEVQIAAYRKPQNFKYGHLLKFGNPEIRNYPDAITRFTQGEFITFSNAEVLRQKVIKEGVEDAWITPFYKGKRMLMKDLINGSYENALSIN